MQWRSGIGFILTGIACLLSKGCRLVAPQGLKPCYLLRGIAARLKSCPSTILFTSRLRPTVVSVHAVNCTLYFGGRAHVYSR
jgi:hypothetical protein